MITVLYVNHGHDERCGVHDLGRRHAQLLDGPDLAVTYVECNSHVEYAQARVEHQPGVVIVNYMPGIMPWVDNRVRHNSHLTLAVIHNYGPDTIREVVREHRRLFDGCIALDPTLLPLPGLIITPRPVPEGVDEPELDDDVLRIGSFGFAFPHKNFQAVAEEIATLDRPAIFELHMPEAFFNGAQGQSLYTEAILAECERQLGPGHELHYTSNHLTATQIVDRLAHNHVNCLFYVPGQHNAGISSALDYLIAARRPILLTDCTMFGHARDYVSIFPDVRLQDIIDEWDMYQAEADDFADLATGHLAAETASQLRSLL